RTAELEQTTALLRRASETDFLTGLPNRRGLQAQLPAIGYGERRAVLLLDIDNFKQINDRYGHECGDGVLRGVAEVLRSCQRAEDLVARWGGEEFMVVLPDTANEDAMQIAS